MSRPLRIEFEDAVYHVTTRGDRREPIFRGDADRRALLDLIAQAMDRFDAMVLAYCLMGNHYHLVLQTRQPNLSRLMRHINGVYTQSFNRRHGLVGHLFQGRFNAILIDRDAYLLALCRYVERNPVAAGIAPSAMAWPWSSYRAHVGKAAPPAWLDVDGLLGHMLGRTVECADDRALAMLQYTALVEQTDAADAAFWQLNLRGQVFLGGQTFVESLQARLPAQIRSASQVPRRQRLPQGDWAQCVAACHGDRNQALHMAYRQHGLTMTHLAAAAGLSIAHVSRLIAAQELGGNEK